MLVIGLKRYTTHHNIPQTLQLIDWIGLGANAVKGKHFRFKTVRDVDVVRMSAPGSVGKVNENKTSINKWYIILEKVRDKNHLLTIIHWMRMNLYNTTQNYDI